MFGQPFYVGHLGRTPVYVGGDILIMVALVWFWTQGGGILTFLTSLSMLLVAVVAHEGGHAAVARALGKQGVTIVIGAFGGVCIYAPERRRLSDMCIQFAGVTTNFVIAAIAWVLLGAGGRVELLIRDETFLGFIVFLFWWNLVLGIFNSLPIYPLDGGQAVLTGSSTLMGDGPRAKRLTLSVSVATAIAGVALAHHFGMLSAFTLVMVLFLLYQAFNDLR
ncbi:MAG: M50 family metallopeptidase [Planctomycetes bacterium]|nr:M50 family metallopeptidase [Planctomycetota bacterium]